MKYHAEEYRFFVLLSPEESNRARHGDTELRTSWRVMKGDEPISVALTERLTKKLADDLNTDALW